jgi:hypothetical protein
MMYYSLLDTSSQLHEGQIFGTVFRFVEIIENHIMSHVRQEINQVSQLALLAAHVLFPSFAARASLRALASRCPI